MSDQQVEIRHVSKHAHRLDEECPSTVRERTFAEQWREDNKAHALLGQLMQDRNFISVFEAGLGVAKSGAPYHRLTQEEAEAAATVIQWLGSNVGWCFLNQCVEKCGYKMVQQKQGSTRS